MEPIQTDAPVPKEDRKNQTGLDMVEDTQQNHISNLLSPAV
jgi:hypothetical protein